MELSDEETRRLAEIEIGLKATSPGLSAKLARPRRATTPNARTAWMALGLIAGLGLSVVAAAADSAWGTVLGVVAFGLTVASARGLAAMWSFADLATRMSTPRPHQPWPPANS